jgi:hypothetical protein
MDKIQNCPFCGSAARLQNHFGVDFWVQCDRDECGSTNGKTTTSRAFAISTWNKRAALAARATPAQPAGDLHNAIMNLPDSICSDMDIGEKRAYQKGHRDARHAAAELVAAHEAASAQPSPSTVAEAIRKLSLPEQGAAWVTPMRYGSKVSFPKPPKPENWDDDESEWFCNPLFDVPQVRALLSEAAALAEQVQGQQDADGAAMRLVIQHGIQLHFEGRWEDSAVWADDVMLWTEGDTVGATRKAIAQAVNKRVFTAPSITQDGQKSEGA